MQFASILLLGALLTAAAQPDPASSQSVSALVNRTIGGDTLDVSIDGVRTPVGLLGATAPAVNAPCGPDASIRLADLAPPGSTLTLVADPDHTGMDPQRRVVLYFAYTADGTSIDETLVTEGLAHAATPALADVEAAAQAQGSGCLNTV